MRVRRIQWTITIAAGLFAGTHVLWPGLALDAITLTLLALAAIPWLAPLFRSVEFPGGIKVEFGDLVSSAQKGEASGLVARDALSISKARYSFQDIGSSDPNLALAGLRIEIESRLGELARSRGIETRFRGAGSLLRELREHGVLANEQAAFLTDLIPLLNAAAHGATVDPRASEWAVDVGPRLLDGLDRQIGTATVESLLARWRARDGAAGFEVGELLSKFLASNPGSFFEAMRGDQDSFRSWLSGLPRHTFTLFQSRNDLEDKLYEAYYERLRGLMNEAITPFLRNEAYRDLAEQLQAKLRSISIRKIE